MDLDALQRSAKEGDKQAERQLFDELAVRFRLLAYHHIWDKEAAKEVVQDSMMVVAENYRTLEVHTSFGAWAHRVFRNRLLAYIKSKVSEAQKRGPGLSDGPEPADNDVDPDLKIQLCECLAKVGLLNRRYARILNLHYQGYFTTDICRRMGISSSNCYVLLSRARIALEQCLRKGGD